MSSFHPAGRKDVAEAAVTALLVALFAGLGEWAADELRAAHKRRRKAAKKAEGKK